MFCPVCRRNDAKNENSKGRRVVEGFWLTDPVCPSVEVVEQQKEEKEGVVS